MAGGRLKLVRVINWDKNQARDNWPGAETLELYSMSGVGSISSDWFFTPLQAN